MKTLRRTVLWGLLLALVAGGYAGWRIGWGQPFTINQLANRQTLLLLLDNPELFTQVGAVDGTVLDRHSGRLKAVGIAVRDRDYARLEQAIADLQRFDRAALTEKDRITYDVLLDFYSSQLALKRFDWLSSEGIYPISPMFGTQVALAQFMQSQHVVSNAKTASNYVERLRAMGPKLDALTAEMRRQADAGVVLPPSLLEKSLLVIGDTIAPAPADNALVTTFSARMASVAELDDARRETLRADAEEVLRASVYPAYARMVAALEQERPRAAATADGVDRLPGGAAYYQTMLRNFTTTDYTPEQVHALGLAEVARIAAQMDELMRGQGLVEGSVGERAAALARNPQFLESNDDAGRERVLQRYRAILDEVSTRMPAYFRDIPPGTLAVERVPPAAEKGSAAAYYNPPALDGSRPGTFFANLRDLAEMPDWGMKTLAYHEGIPGHHFQIAAAQQLDGLPLIRQQPIYAAFAEGWALYAERLAAEIGLYDGDPLGDLGRLRAEMFRAVRLVTDTGIHAGGWTREQAIDYMRVNTGLHEAEVVTEIERYMALPGQACAYKVGQLKILELRERARSTLGGRFDLKEFHAVVLGNGTVPLTVLETLVEQWIAARGA